MTKQSIKVEVVSNEDMALAIFNELLTCGFSATISIAHHVIRITAERDLWSDDTGDDSTMH